MIKAFEAVVVGTSNDNDLCSPKGLVCKVVGLSLESMEDWRREGEQGRGIEA